MMPSKQINCKFDWNEENELQVHYTIDTKSYSIKQIENHVDLHREDIQFITHVDITENAKDIIKDKFNTLEGCSETIITTNQNPAQGIDWKLLDEYQFALTSVESLSKAIAEFQNVSA